MPEYIIYNEVVFTWVGGLGWGVKRRPNFNPWGTHVSGHLILTSADSSCPEESFRAAKSLIAS
jgi:hypothetical protein